MIFSLCAYEKSAEGIAEGSSRLLKKSALNAMNN